MFYQIAHHSRRGITGSGATQLWGLGAGTYLSKVHTRLAPMCSRVSGRAPTHPPSSAHHGRVHGPLRRRAEPHVHFRRLDVGCASQGDVPVQGQALRNSVRLARWPKRATVCRSTLSHATRLCSLHGFVHHGSVRACFRCEMRGRYERGLHRMVQPITVTDY